MSAKIVSILSELFDIVSHGNRFYVGIATIASSISIQCGNWWNFLTHAGGSRLGILGDFNGAGEQRYDGERLGG
jgi:hypothetical protein